MAIVAGDIEFRLSGGAANTDPNAALGGAMSTAGGGLITSAALHNLFDKVTGDEAAAGDVEYRCIYIKNTHAMLTWEGVKLWIDSQPADADDTIHIALAGEGKNGGSETIADESTAPVGEVFTAPADKAGGLALGDMAPDDTWAVWVRRTIGVGAGPADAESVVLKAEGDTAA